MTTIETIRLFGAEFEDVDNETLEKWIEVVKPLVSKEKFGKLYDNALAYLVCHNMKKNSMENLIDALEGRGYEITLPEDIMVSAVRPIERMLEWS